MESLFNSLSRGDVDEVVANCASAVQMHVPFQPEPYPGSAIGKDELHRFLYGATRLFSPFVLEVLSVWSLREVDGLLVEYVSQGKSTRTGKDYENRYLAIFEFSEGLIVRWTEFHNPLKLVEALS